MDQIARLREAADVQHAAGRTPIAAELRALADELEVRARDEHVAGVLVEAARRRGRGAPAGRGAKGADHFMPGALPLAVRKKVPADVASIYDGAGAKVVHNALARLRGTFAEEMERAKEEIKAAIGKQFGADGISRYLPFMGEWADSILANLFEHGHGEMTRSHEAGNPLLAAVEARTPFTNGQDLADELYRYDPDMNHIHGPYGMGWDKLLAFVMRTWGVQEKDRSTVVKQLLQAIKILKQRFPATWGKYYQDVRATVDAQESAGPILSTAPLAPPAPAAPAAPAALQAAQFLGIVPPGPGTADGTLIPPTTTTSAAR